MRRMYVGRESPHFGAVAAKRRHRADCACACAFASANCPRAHATALVTRAGRQLAPPTSSSGALNPRMRPCGSRAPPRVRALARPQAALEVRTRPRAAHAWARARRMGARAHGARWRLAGERRAREPAHAWRFARSAWPHAQLGECARSAWRCARSASDMHWQRARARRRPRAARYPHATFARAAHTQTRAPARAGAPPGPGAWPRDARAWRGAPSALPTSALHEQPQSRSGICSAAARGESRCTHSGRARATTKDIVPSQASFDTADKEAKHSRAAPRSASLSELSCVSKDSRISSNARRPNW